MSEAPALLHYEVLDPATGKVLLDWWALEGQPAQVLLALSPGTYTLRQTGGKVAEVQPEVEHKEMCRHLYHVNYDTGARRCSLCGHTISYHELLSKT